MMTKSSKLIYFIISVIFFIISDLYFSDLILNNYQDSVPQNSFFDLIFVQNQGAAFSILENFKGFLIAFSVLALFTIFIYLFKNIMKYSSIACFWTAMLVSGISCNLYERIAYGYVRDFIKLNFNKIIRKIKVNWRKAK